MRLLRTRQSCPPGERPGGELVLLLKEFASFSNDELIYTPMPALTDIDLPLISVGAEGASSDSSEKLDRALADHGVSRTNRRTNP